MAKLAYLDKIPEPPRPLPPGKSEHANDRGHRIHTALEGYVQGQCEFPTEAADFRSEIDKLKELFSKGYVSLEGNWAVDKEWSPVSWFSDQTWLRVQLDAFVKRGKKALVIDYKSGKRYGNEIKHAEQCQLYQLAAFMRYPELEEIVVELWYLDIGEIVTFKFTRNSGIKFLKPFSERGETLTSETEFRPKPNMFSCKWCPYGPKGTGHCSVGIQ